ncbi:Spore germination protein YndE [Clostridium liquoris]|jgi:spore germination protein|uniref:Spore germination protein YndE n=1 Tax=Clostridium liquoris TaxID=1289519 RepID=A0A2T0B646_9CLOT|nr:GerAB/ArcD/ProY family transporter [Clostridium liquoris]PRR79359.1 Spore germination protein YndE [Clostridium liquoris]
MNENLTNRQIAFYIFGAVVGYSIISLPKQAAEYASTAGWISIIMSTIIALIEIYIITFLNYTFKNMTIYEYSRILVGKFTSNIFIILFIIYTFMLSSMSIRDTANIVKNSILIKTPIWIIIFILLCLCYYASSKGLQVLGRLCEVYGIFIIIFTILISIVSFQQGNILNLLPIQGFNGIIGPLKSLSQLIAAFLGAEFLLVVPFNEKNNKSVFKYTLFIIVFIGLFYIIVFESTLSIIGAEDLIHYYDALLTSAKRIDIHFLEFFRKIDGFVLTTWIMAVFTTISISAYVLTFFIKKLFKINNTFILSIVIIILSFIASQLPQTIEDVRKVLSYTSYLGIFYSFIIPLILYIVAKVKKYDKENL